jgi:uncharacterized protein (AIM24 family)
MSRIELKRGETICVEPGAVHAFFDCVTQTNRVAKTIKEMLTMFCCANESILCNSLTANSDQAWVELEERAQGQTQYIDMPAGSEIVLCNGALVASSNGIVFKAHVHGIDGGLSGKGILGVKATSASGGFVVIGTRQGYIKSYEIYSNAPLHVDNNCVLAFSPTVHSKAYLFAGNPLSNEGFFNQFEGHGRVYCSSSEITKRGSSSSGKPDAATAGSIFVATFLICMIISAFGGDWTPFLERIQQLFS